MWIRRTTAAAAAAVVVVACFSACSRSNNGPAASITVFAAASLRQTFTHIGERFKAQTPGTSVEFDFAGSSDLVTQLTQGANADVYASADTTNMTKAAQAGLLASDPVNFASNTLTIAAAPGNPKKISSFADLNRPGLSVVVCEPQVPCGSATKRIEDSTGIQLHPVSEEPSVTDVLNKVTSGQADAALVYVTDALGAGNKVTFMNFPQAAGATNTYPIAVLRASKNADMAKKFVNLVTGQPGQHILRQAGFGKP